MKPERSPDLLSVRQKTRKAGGVIQSESKGPRTNQGANGVSSGLSPNRRTRSTYEQGQGKRMDVSVHAEGENAPSSAFLFYSCPQVIRCCPPALVRVDLFTQFIDSNVNVFWRHPHRHIQKWYFTSFLGVA